MGIVVVSRRVARAGRPQSWVRHGECAGHHRGLRAGHGLTGGRRERGRATGLLDVEPGVGDRVTQGPGVVGALRPGHEPCGETTNGEKHARYRGTSDKGRTPRGTGGSRRGASYRGRWGPEAQGTHGRTGDDEQRFPWARNTRETVCSPIVSPDPPWPAPRAAAALREEPSAV